MPIYEVTRKEFRRIEEKGFSISGLKERSDIQRLLRTQIDVISEDLYVLTEEFSEWEESKRRIDILAVDANANLVVLELKRTSRSEEHTSELQSQSNLVCRLLLEKKKNMMEGLTAILTL